MTTERASRALVLLLFAVTPAVHGQEAHVEPPTLALSPELRAALVEEMQQLELALQRISSALPRGDWAALAESARQIRASFVLERKLSPEQRAELERALPREFLDLDRRFHREADRLAGAARGADAELAAFFVYRLVDTCITCHALYASHRFPALRSGVPADPGH